MPPTQLARRRIPWHLRPLRPPNPIFTKSLTHTNNSNTNHANPRPLFRPFTHNSQLLLLSSNTPRPQLAFLYYPSRSSGRRGRGVPYGSVVTLNHALSRLMTTERRRNLRILARDTFRNVVYILTFIFAAGALCIGVWHQDSERRNPTPPEWGFWSRWHLRTARGREDVGDDPLERTSNLLYWADLGKVYLKLLKRLEDSDQDGVGIKEPLDGEGEGGGILLIPGLGKTGLDIRGKSYMWRDGYWEALMGAGRTAEHMEGWVQDTSRGGIVFPANMMIGPSNPRPKPVVWGLSSNKAPLEENCKPAMESPEYYYVKILTTTGFTSRQRLDAALAYADWLDFKGLNGTAREVLSWAMDIATANLPHQGKDVVDIKTGVIKDKPLGKVSRNVLAATSALGVHHARMGNVQDALAIFLAVLRARKALPPDSDGTPQGRSVSRKLTDQQLLEAHNNKQHDPENPVIAFFKRWFTQPAYPQPQPTGDEPPLRTKAEMCEEAGIMVYIGEILFATSSEEQGLAWTRDAVDGAEAVVKTMMPQHANRHDVTHCRECLKTGFSNWRKMVDLIVEREREKNNQWPEPMRRRESLSPSWSLPSEKEKEKEKKNDWGLGWMWTVVPSSLSLSSSSRKQEEKKRKMEAMERLERWEAEKLAVEERAKEIRPLVGGFVTLGGMEGRVGMGRL